MPNDVQFQFLGLLGLWLVFGHCGWMRNGHWEQCKPIDACISVLGGHQTLVQNQSRFQLIINDTQVDTLISVYQI